MIKEKFIEIKIAGRNISKYKELGYVIDGKTLSIKSEDLSDGSSIKVTAICELCSSENIIGYSKYIQNKSRRGFYSCFGCKNVKKEMTCMETYGVSSYSKTDEFIESQKSIKGIRGEEKMKKTMMDRYGVDHFSKMPKFREKMSKWMSSDEFSEKSKKSLIKKYGVDSYSKTDEFKQNISNDKHKIVSKIMNTSMEKYGVEWISQLDDIQEKMKITRIKNGHQVSDDMRTKYELYRKNVDKLTRRLRKSLFESWDGIDYYDNEFIGDNIRLEGHDGSYPTVDHKISVYHGYMNNIDVEIIADIKNLCITKRYINSKKRERNEDDFTI